MSKQLDNLDPQAREMFRRGLNFAAIQIFNEATTSIAQHKSKGVTYKRGNVTHTASAPGNPPNRDTGALTNSIYKSVDQNSLVATVGAKAEHAAPLEYGTSKMKKRPFMRPAYEKAKPYLMKLFALEVKK